MESTIKTVVIDENYYIEIDVSNYTLYKKITSTKGKPGLVRWYFGSIEHCLTKVYRCLAEDSLETQTTILQYIKSLKKVKEDLADLVKKEVS